MFNKNTYREIKIEEERKLKRTADIKSAKGDLFYAKEDDRDLSQEQIKEIDRFWGKYSFAFSPNYNGFKTYYNRTGTFDVRNIPFYFRNYFADKYFEPDKYRVAYQNKAFLPKIFDHFPQPECVIKKIGKVYLDDKFNKISENDAIKRVHELNQQEELVFKVSSSKGGGGGVSFGKGLSEEDIKEILSRSISMIVQSAIMQNKQMLALNESTINTVRMTTYLRSNGEVVPLAALIKVGNPNYRVDNYKHGGLLIGIDIDTGHTNDWALNIDRNSVNRLPSGFDLNGGFDVPYFSKAVEYAVQSHYGVAYIRLISWDIAISETGPVLVEANFSGDLRMHQAVSGPLFREYTEEVLDELLLKKYFKSGMTKQYDYEEYYDHIRLSKCYEDKEQITVPGEINGKKVTRIKNGTFKSLKKLRTITIPPDIKNVSSDICAEGVRIIQ